jgi:hypothetical protein
MKTDIDHLKKEKEQEEALEQSFTNNPFKAVIQQLFHEEFSSTKYRKYDKAKALALLDEKLSPVLAAYHGIHLPGGLALLRSLKKAKTLEDVLIKMNEYLFS